MWPSRLNIHLVKQNSDAGVTSALIHSARQTEATTTTNLSRGEGDVSEQSKRAIRTVVAIFFDFLVAASALSMFRAIEIMIEFYWSKAPEMLANDVTAAQQFVTAAYRPNFDPPPRPDLCVKNSYKAVTSQAS